jgi:hypothetical protein
MAELSKERARLGDDKEPILIERLMNPRRPPFVKPLAEKPAVRPSKRPLARKRA